MPDVPMVRPAGRGVVGDMAYVSGGGVVPPDPVTGMKFVDGWPTVRVFEGMDGVAVTGGLTVSV